MRQCTDKRTRGHPGRLAPHIVQTVADDHRVPVSYAMFRTPVEPADATIDDLWATGTKPERKNGAAFLREFVEEAKASGLVATLIKKHGVDSRLTVAPPAN